MSIYGIGTDIVEIARIEQALSRHGERFDTRLLHTDALPDWQAALAPAAWLAKRFAAKEAFAKALGTGLRGVVTLRNIGLQHDALGRPVFFCAPVLAAELALRGIQQLHLSLSDERAYVLAFVVMENQSKPSI